MTGSMGHTGAKEIFCFGVDSLSEKLSTPKQNGSGTSFPSFHVECGREMSVGRSLAAYSGQTSV